MHWQDDGMIASTVAPLAVGQVAPDFSLRDQNGVEVSLSAITAEKNAVLVFYPFAFSGICTGELDEIRDHLERFVSDDLQVVCISCDPMFAPAGLGRPPGLLLPPPVRLLAARRGHPRLRRAQRAHRGAGARHVPRRPATASSGGPWSTVPGERRDFGGLPAEVAALS